MLRSWQPAIIQFQGNVSEACKTESCRSLSVLTRSPACWRLGVLGDQSVTQYAQFLKVKDNHELMWHQEGLVLLLIRGLGYWAQRGVKCLNKLQTPADQEWSTKWVKIHLPLAQWSGSQIKSPDKAYQINRKLMCCQSFIYFFEIIYYFQYFHRKSLDL